MTEDKVSREFTQDANLRPSSKIYCLRSRSLVQIHNRSLGRFLLSNRILDESPQYRLGDTLYDSPPRTAYSAHRWRCPSLTYRHTDIVIHIQGDAPIGFWGCTQKRGISKEKVRWMTPLQIRFYIKRGYRGLHEIISRHISPTSKHSAMSEQPGNGQNRSFMKFPTNYVPELSPPFFSVNQGGHPELTRQRPATNFLLLKPPDQS